ncbi:hypothetical protein INT47_005583 [Mucor saturninus]|uniref:Uncharacterized protein n=1 Tax=Mucor saturninus TaxID=64648 RepID=A0A8H7RDP7_9FUNG|nr:hypothetical protein INT47_005583 [Mucor saturninus]
MQHVYPKIQKPKNLRASRNGANQRLLRGTREPLAVAAALTIPGPTDTSVFAVPSLVSPGFPAAVTTDHTTFAYYVKMDSYDDVDMADLDKQIVLPLIGQMSIQDADAENESSNDGFVVDGEVDVDLYGSTKEESFEVN